MRAGIEPQSRDADQGRLELLTALTFAIRHWYWIAGGAAIAGIAAFGAGLLMPRIYEAEVTALPVKDQQGLPSLRSLAGGYGALASLAGIALPGSENSAEMALVRLKSRGFLEEFIREEALLPELFPKQWDVESRAWRRGPPPTYQDGYLLLSRKMLRASVDKRSGTVSLKLRWTDPKKAATWANRLVDRMNRVTRKIAIEDASTSVKYLSEELDNTQSVELRSSIAMLLENQVNKRMLAATQPDYALKVIDAARPSDSDRYVSPRRTVLTIGGAVAGALIGAYLAFLYGGRSRSGRARSYTDAAASTKPG